MVHPELSRFFAMTTTDERTWLFCFYPHKTISVVFSLLMNEYRGYEREREQALLIDCNGSSASGECDSSWILRCIYHGNGRPLLNKSFYLWLHYLLDQISFPSSLQMNRRVFERSLSSWSSSTSLVSHWHPLCWSNWRPIMISIRETLRDFSAALHKFGLVFSLDNDETDQLSNQIRNYYKCNRIRNDLMKMNHFNDCEVLRPCSLQEELVLSDQIRIGTVQRVFWLTGTFSAVRNRVRTSCIQFRLARWCFWQSQW